MVAKVLSSNIVLLKGGPSSLHNICPTLITECLIGDETGTIIFIACNEQVFLENGDWNFDSEVVDFVGSECICFKDEFLYAFSSYSFHSRGVSTVKAFYELLSQSSLNVLNPKENKLVARVELCPILKINGVSCLSISNAGGGYSNGCKPMAMNLLFQERPGNLKCAKILKDNVVSE
ncbi:hypothetical protein JHK84_045345 [Glycine max]|nr:hypothetical protein JHK84_045345 [Glycine max]